MIRKANIKDIKEIHALINSYAKKETMLPRSFAELYENVRDFFVYKEREKVQGCCALHICWQDLAEVKSLAVEPKQKGKGIGAKLLRSAIDEARTLGMKRLFVLTYAPEFFKQHGFKMVDKAQMPHKIWSECINCAKFPDCDEAALVLEL